MSEEILKAQRALNVKVESLKKRAVRAQDRVQRLKDNLAEAESELTTANAECATLEKQLQELVRLFPVDLTEEKPKSVQVKPAGTTGPKRPTMIDSMRLVMGNEVMTAPQVEKALKENGLDRKSSNLRGYISTLLSSNEQEIIGPDGQKVLVDGKPAMYKAFICVERGHYRVAPIPTGVTSDDVIESTTTAEDLLVSQGLNVNDLLTDRVLS